MKSLPMILALGTSLAVAGSALGIDREPDTGVGSSELLTREQRQARLAEAALTKRGQMDNGGVTGGPGWMLNPPDRKWRIRGSAELGFVGVVAHKIQLSEDGTEWDYVDNGGQDVLFPYTRLQAELEL